MNFSGAFLRTRVARRVLALFALCALLPITALAILSYSYVTRQLEQQSQERVRKASKLTGMAMLERLHFLETELAALTSTVGPLLGTSLEDWPSRFTPVLSGRFAGVAAQQGTRSVTLSGSVPTLPSLSETQKDQLRGGRPVLAVADEPVEPPIFIGRAIDPADATKGSLWAVLEPEYMWRVGDDDVGLLSDGEMCVFDDAWRALYCSRPVEAAVLEQLEVVVAVGPEAAGDDRNRIFEWHDPFEGGTNIAGYWSVFLRNGYGIADWTTVVSESRTSVLAPMARFRRTFPFVVLLSLWVVLLMSNIQIRRSMDPLFELQKGTQRVAKRDFGTPVEVTSRDEFEDLANSFNAMTQRISRQFTALAAMNEIDRAVLSALDNDRIVDTVLSRTQEVFPCDSVTICLETPSGADGTWTQISLDATDGARHTRDVRPSAENIRELQQYPTYLQANADVARGYLTPEAPERGSARSHLVFPMFRKDSLAGVIALGFTDIPAFHEEDLVQARQLTDQVSVALANSRLVQELDEMSWGTLLALGRTIDAKSKWTAGHSDRVTAAALAIAHKMQLSDVELDQLHRGGLLHDIGKIGVPAAVLDKPGKLNDEERRLVSLHPEIGARILAPIAAYQDVIPIVLYHHEKLDGTGYPEGLVGNDIPFLARVLAVADVYDALKSERPYRAGMALSKVRAIFEESVGSHFDGDIVGAFLAVIDEDGVEALHEPVAGLEADTVASLTLNTQPAGRRTGHETGEELRGLADGEQTVKQQVRVS